MLNNMPEGTRNLALVDDPGDPDNEFELDDEVDIGKQENIKVVVRVRPLMEHEVLRTAGSDGNPDNGHQVLSLDPPDGKSLTVNGAEARHQLRVRFDACFGAESTQEQVYSQIKECASAVVKGVNATVFAYGQTGTGKTHTMFGPPGHVQELAAAGGQGAHAFGAMSGVIPRALVDVFEQLHALATPTQQQQQQQHGGQGDEGEASPTATIASYAVYVSFVQIYNEQVFDMLRDPSRGKPLEIHEEDMGGGVYVQGLSEYGVGSFADCLELLRLGEENRAIRETHMNQASSRSHSIFTVLVEQTRRPQRPSSAEGGGGGGGGGLDGGVSSFASPGMPSPSQPLPFKKTTNSRSIRAVPSTSDDEDGRGDNESVSTPTPASSLLLLHHHHHRSTGAGPDPEHELDGCVRHAWAQYRSCLGRYLEWHFAYECKELEGYLQRIEGLVSTRGVSDVRIHESKDRLLSTIRDHASTRVLREKFKQIYKRVAKHLDVKLGLLPHAWASFAAFLQRKWELFSTRCRQCYDVELNPPPRVLGNLVREVGGEL